MAVNEVVFGAVSIMNISDSTVTPDTLAQGVTAYDKTGEKITGTMKSSEDLTTVLNEQEAIITELEAALEGKAAGGGSGGELQYVTDTFTLTNSGVVASGAVVGTVTGLSFKPKHVVVWVDSGGNNVLFPTTAKNEYTLISAQTGFITNYNYIRFGTSSQVTTSNAYATLTITDDGFSLVSASGSLFVFGTLSYKYLAIG